MYAVIKTGGKQYRVQVGDLLKVETLAADVDSDFSFEDVLMIADGDNITVGSPMVEGAAVTASVKEHGRHKKVEIIKFKRRKHHQKRTGHRQNYTLIEITDIAGTGGAKKAPAKKAAAKADDKPAAKNEAAKKDSAKAEAKPAAKKEAAAGNDDLKKLTAVGPKLADELNKAGISSYAQVAALSAAECEALADKVDFKGALKWDEIIASAKEMS